MSIRTLKLNNNWDLTIDRGGRLVLAEDAYATAQDVANTIRLFTEDAYLDWDRGIPHFTLDLTIRPSLAAVRSRYRAAALAVDNVADAVAVINELDEDRAITGDIRLTTDNGEIAIVEI